LHAPSNAAVASPFCAKMTLRELLPLLFFPLAAQWAALKRWPIEQSK
jgi:hypothetical protein